MKNLSAKASKIYNLLEVRHCEQDNKGIYCIYPKKFSNTLAICYT